MAKQPTIKLEIKCRNCGEEITTYRKLYPDPASVFFKALEEMEETEHDMFKHALKMLATIRESEAHHPDGIDWDLQEHVPQIFMEWLDNLDTTIQFLREYVMKYTPEELQEAIKELPEPDRMPCVFCEKWFVPERSTAKYCTTACKQAAYRRRK